MPPTASANFCNKSDERASIMSARKKYLNMKDFEAGKLA